MPRLLVIDDRDQTIEMCHRHLRSSITSRAAGGGIPCQVCEERDKGCTLKCAHNADEAAEALGQEETLPDLVVLDLHFALPEAQLLPRNRTPRFWRRSAAARGSTSSTSCARTIPPCRGAAHRHGGEHRTARSTRWCTSAKTRWSTPGRWPLRSRAHWRCSTRRRKGRCSGDAPRRWPSCAARSRSWPGARCRC